MKFQKNFPSIARHANSAPVGVVKICSSISCLINTEQLHILHMTSRGVRARDRESQVRLIIQLVLCVLSFSRISGPDSIYLYMSCAHPRQFVAWIGQGEKVHRVRKEVNDEGSKYEKQLSISMSHARTVNHRKNSSFPSLLNSAALHSAAATTLVRGKFATVQTDASRCCDML